MQFIACAEENFIAPPSSERGREEEQAYILKEFVPPLSLSLSLSPSHPTPLLSDNLSLSNSVSSSGRRIKLSKVPNLDPLFWN